MNHFKNNKGLAPSKVEGFTLVEMLLVLIVLSLVFFPLVQLFGNGILAGTNTSNNFKALSLAQQKMEQIKNTSYANIASSSEPKGSILDFPDFSRYVSVDEIFPNLKDIDVIVSWEAGTASDSFKIKTYVANY